MYRNRTQRCRHGFAIGLVRCEQCSGKWKGQKPEPRPVGAKFTVVNRRVQHPQGAPRYGRQG